MINKIFLLTCVVLCAEGGFEEDCGLEDISSQPQVLGGKRVISREFPWHVAIFLNTGSGDNYNLICGGSLVRSQLVITAAHCFSLEEYNHTAYLEQSISAYRVVGGSLHSSWTTENLNGRQQSEVRTVVLGETYGANSRNYQDDIAIVHLQTEFIFSPVVRAVCLDLMDRELHDSQTSPGRMGKVAGWGLSESGTVSNRLNFLTVPVVGNMQCYLQTPMNSRRDVTSDKICAGLTNGSAMCPGDSGGGLVFPLQGSTRDAPRWYLRAVLSNAPRSEDPFNELCQTKYLFLYSNIFSHKTWLSINMERLQPQKRCRARGSVGSCKKFTNCPAAKEDASHGILPQLCSPSSTKICCVVTCPPLPSNSQRKTGSMANDYCVNLPEKLYPCQQNGSSWSRGDLCGPKPEDHNPLCMARPLDDDRTSTILRYKFVPNTAGGTPVFLVSEHWLLTTVTNWNQLLRRYFYMDYVGRPEIIFSPGRTVPHPKYIPAIKTEYYYEDPGTNDIILVEMNKPALFSGKYRPVCLHTAQDSLEGLALSRWEKDIRFPATLMSQDECRRQFPPGSIGARDGVTDSHLCTTTSSEKGCGLSWHLTASLGQGAACTQLLVGLHLDSKIEGSICMEMFLRLSSYIPWVESVVWP